jgi:hypothetical protein
VPRIDYYTFNERSIAINNTERRAFEAIPTQQQKVTQNAVSEEPQIRKEQYRRRSNDVTGSKGRFVSIPA